MPGPDGAAPVAGTARRCAHALALCHRPTGPLPLPHLSPQPPHHLITNRLPQFYLFLICDCSTSHQTVDLDPSEGRGSWSLTTRGKARHVLRRTEVIVRWTAGTRCPARCRIVKWLTWSAPSFPARTQGIGPSHLGVATKPKPMWDVHLTDSGNRAGNLAGSLRPLIAGTSGSAVSPSPSG